MLTLNIFFNKIEKWKINLIISACQCQRSFCGAWNLTSIERKPFFQRKNSFLLKDHSKNNFTIWTDSFALIFFFKISHPEFTSGSTILLLLKKI
jgi:hypothetical protein